MGWIWTLSVCNIGDAGAWRAGPRKNRYILYSKCGWLVMLERVAKNCGPEDRRSNDKVTELHQVVIRNDIAYQRTMLELLIDCYKVDAHTCCLCVPIL